MAFKIYHKYIIFTIIFLGNWSPYQLFKMKKMKNLYVIFKIINYSKTNKQCPKS
jgi:hypothetical protein